MRRAPTLVIGAIAICAIVLWAFVGAHATRPEAAYFAPVVADYAYRNATIAFYERRTKIDPEDQISRRILAEQYLQRFREEASIDDVLRSIRQATASLKLENSGNAAGDEVLAGAYTALHQFHRALQFERAASSVAPYDANALAQIASLNMELGNYGGADMALRKARRLGESPTLLSVQARYDELTGHLARARELMDAAAAWYDESSDNSAQARSWFHYRSGELAFEAGAIERAQESERVALRIFPRNEMALRALARFCASQHEWTCAMTAAQRAVALVPEPESLGYLEDAQRATGQVAAANRTRALIFVVERLANRFRVNDRLLAVYYSNHSIRAADALAIARREVAVRGHEVYAQDTLAWAAFRAGNCPLALGAAREATRLGTEDARIDYHAGVIAFHCGEIERARTFLQGALALNGHFDIDRSDEARTLLGLISRRQIVQLR